MGSTRVAGFEVITVMAILATYVLWLASVLFGHNVYIVLWLPATALVLAFYWSLVHEVVHGHPTRNAFVNRLFILFPIGWVFPYERFRDTHIQHHTIGNITDPLDDPESWYLFPSDWSSKSSITQSILTFNNTLFGRMMIGPVISLSRYYSSELSLVFSDPKQRYGVIGAWLLHITLCTGQILFIAQYSEVPAWAYFASAYLAISFLLIRTFLEHQAAEDFGERTVIIEKCCPIAFLFLFNNLHAVHHHHPGIPWYQLPSHYRHNKDTYLEMNKYYHYSSYGEIFRRYFFWPKEVVSYPIGENRNSA